MAKKYISWVFVGFVLFFLTTNAQAFDGQRKGFLLGIGIGPGLTSYTQKVSVYGFDWGVALALNQIARTRQEL